MNPESANAANSTQNPADAARRALAVGLELAKNAARARTLDELQFILVNDTRSLIEFDRCSLLVDFDGRSALVATNNQPKLETKSDFVPQANKLAEALKNVNRGLVVVAGRPPAEELPEQAAEGIREYMEYARCSCLMVVPLIVYDHVVGHLIFEFFQNSAPGGVETYTLMNMAPFLSSALAEKWVLDKKPALRNSFWNSITGASATSGIQKYLKYIIPAAALILIIAWFFPVTLNLGGKAEAAPEHEYFAFVEMDGIVDKVFVREGDRVTKGQILATLKEQEIDYKIREAQRLLESYKAEMEILRNLGAENPSKLAESRLVAIKSLRAKQDLDFLNWQRQFLDVKSPIDGVVLTKKVESLLGKKFKAGDSFCRIAPSDALVVEIFVKESDVSFVKPGQSAEVFFNFRPYESMSLKVKSVSPISETMERVGAVFRVKADFTQPPGQIKPGMQGVAHVAAGNAGLGFVLTRRIVTRINEMFLVF